MKTKIKKFLFILKKEHKKKLSLLLFLMIIGSFIELLSIGLIIPFIGIVAEEKILKLDLIPTYVVDLATSLDKSEFFLMGLLFFVLLYLIKSLYLIFYSFFQNKLVFTVQADLASILFKKYLKQNYLFHVNKNSSLILRNIINETHLFTEGILLQGMIFLSEFVVFLLIVFLLIYINPLTTLAALVLLSSIIIIFTISTRKKIKDLGNKRQYNEAHKIKEVNHALGSIKEIILYAKRSYFINRMTYFGQKVANSAQLQASILSIPRLSLEFVCILSILLIALFMVNLNYPFSLIIQTVVIFAVSAFRLIPAANRISNFFQYVFYHHVVIEVLYDELKLNNLLKNIQGNKLDFKKKISLKNVNFCYPGIKKNTLENINFEIRKSESIGIVGESGSGKSTLVNVILGILENSNGKILVDDTDVYSNLEHWQSKIGYVPQEIYLLDDTIEKNIAFGIVEEDIDSKLVENCINSVFLQKFISNLPEGVKTNVGERGLRISGGQKQRIGIARALYRNPEILIFDESTSSLDPKTEEELINDIFFIKKQKTIIFITHKMELLKRFDKVFEIKNNNLIKKD